MENGSPPGAPTDPTTREAAEPFARMAASFEVMGRDRGFAPADRRAVVMAGVAEYRDRIAIASYLGRSDAFDRAIADFSVAYADQTERDYAAFSAAVDSGRLVAQTGL